MNSDEAEAYNGHGGDDGHDGRNDDGDGNAD